MKIIVNGYDPNGQLSSYDLAKKNTICCSKAELCDSWIFLITMVLIVSGLSYICLEGGLARRGYLVQVKGETGKEGCKGKMGNRGKSGYASKEGEGGVVTREFQEEVYQKFQQLERSKIRMERNKKQRQRIIEKEILEGKRTKSGAKIT